jgi:hypothetical protein
MDFNIYNAWPLNICPKSVLYACHTFVMSSVRPIRGKCIVSIRYGRDGEHDIKGKERKKWREELVKQERPCSQQEDGMDG